MRSVDELLFNKYGLRKVIEGQENNLSSEIEGYDRNYILNVCAEDLCNCIASGRMGHLPFQTQCVIRLRRIKVL